MKKFVIICCALVFGAYELMAQSADCMGLKNPTSFTFTGGNANSAWSGMTGTKQARASTCTLSGSNFTTTVPASSLTTISSGSSCTSNNGTDYFGQQDYQRRFVIKGAGTDPATGNHLSYLPPDPSFTTSIRLGNYCGGTEAEMLTYEFDVNANNSLVTIWYALSLQNGQHDNAQNPEFVITVEKQVGTSWVPAGGDTLCYIRPTPAGSGSNVAPFYVGSTGTQTGATYGCNLYLPWNKVMLNLSRLTFQRVRIKIAAGDCSYTAHYACCFIAGECAPMRLNANGCAAGNTDAVATIAAPKGATFYRWYRSRNGKLTGSDRTDTNNYVFVEGGANDSILQVTMEYFRNLTTNEVGTQTTFMCKMKTMMNETYEIITPIYTDVNNTKPRLGYDTVLNCSSGVTLRDLSITPYVARDSDLVDTNLTQWWFYNQPNATSAMTAADSAIGGTVTYDFSEPGLHTVRIRTSAVDTSCWNEKTFNVRTIQAPVPNIRLERNNLCKGDRITLTNGTLGGAYHEWIFHFPEGDSISVMPGPAIQMTFDTTTRVTLRTRDNNFYMADTNNDGIRERVYCYTTIDTVIHVGNYPTLTVSGDTIVCNGDRSEVTVNSDVPNCVYNWYSVLGATTPVHENTNFLNTTISQDRTYYVKATSPFGCESWDSVKLYLVNPSLDVTKDKICTGDTVMLWAGRAATYEWTASTSDASFIGQEGNDTIVVYPTETTTYTVVGHGTNGCSATALSRKITVYPYPVLQVSLTPDYIDSENPSVQFADLSENAVSSLWNFGNGNTSTIRTVVFTFTDLSQDSILVSLTSSNQLGCSRDTSFWVPVGIFTVWYPNAFTPKLETNKIFKVFTANQLDDYELYIYDRGGNLVFQTNDPEEGWDGTYKGKECKSGTYVYISKYRRSGVERLMQQKGTVTLIK